MSYLREKLPQTDVAPVETFTPDLKGLVKWLETQDPATEYNYHEYCDCLAARFAIAVGHDVNDQLSLIGFKNYYVICANDPAPTPETYPKPGEWTYGAALTRARKVLQSSRAEGAGE